MITHLSKEGFDEVTYARPARHCAFDAYLADHVGGSVAYFTEVGGSSRSMRGTFAALARLLESVRVVMTGSNRWVVVDYPNYPASVPRRMPVFVAAFAYTLALRAACSVRGVGLVVQSDDDPAMQDEWMGRPLSRMELFWERSLERCLFRWADRLWFNSEVSAELICGRFGVPLDKASVVPNGALVAERSARPANDGRFRFVYAGALLPDSHGVRQLIEEFAKVADDRARLVLCGPEGGWIPGYLAEHPDPRVEYLGVLTAEEAQALLARCDMGILAGDRNSYHSTGFPGKLGAYLAAGIPVLSLVEGDAARIIRRHGNGMLCEPAALATTMAHVASDSTRYEQLRAASRALEDGYSWEAIYAAAVEGLLGGAARHDGRPASRSARGHGLIVDGDTDG